MTQLFVVFFSFGTCLQTVFPLHDSSLLPATCRSDAEGRHNWRRPVLSCPALNVDVSASLRTRHPHFPNGKHSTSFLRSVVGLWPSAALLPVQRRSAVCAVTRNCNGMFTVASPLCSGGCLATSSAPDRPGLAVTSRESYTHIGAWRPVGL